MRPQKRLAVSVATLVGVGSLLWGIRETAGMADLAVASEMTSSAPTVCSLATLHGTYIFATESVQVSEPGAGPFAYAGFVTYDGKGHVSEVYTISANGAVSRAVTEKGTYTVNRDCTASEVDSGAPGIGTQHYDEFLKPDGSQFAYIQTDSGVVSAGTLIRTVNPSKAD